MVATRPMTSLAADGVVRGLGADLMNDGVEVGRMTIQAAPRPIAREHLLAQVFFRIGRPGRQTGGDVPAGSPRGSIVGHADQERLPPIVLADEGRVVIGGAERVSDDRTPDLVALREQSRRLVEGIQGLVQSVNRSKPAPAGYSVPAKVGPMRAATLMYRCRSITMSARWSASLRPDN